MTYKDRITDAMELLAKDKRTVFLGEGLINAGRIYGTLDKVSTTKCIEFPIAENLIVGSAIGLAIKGFIPIVIFQRMDFMLVAADAIINHLALIPKMSGGKVSLPVIIRAIIGSRDGCFDVGPQHNKDLTNMFSPFITTVKLDKLTMDINKHYLSALNLNAPILIVEDRDLYNK